MLNFIDSTYTTDSGRIEREGNTVSLIAEGTVSGQKFYDEQESFCFNINNEFQNAEYFFMEYSCQGLRRQLSRRKPLFYAKLADGSETPLVCYDDITMDNRRHTIAVRLSCGSYTGVRVEFGIDRRKKAQFNIHQMEVCSAKELPVCCVGGRTQAANAYSCIDISQHFNAKQPDFQDIMIDGGRFFDQKNISLYGIPFLVETDGNNIIAPPPPPKENDDIIMNFGVPSRRRLCRPISRDSLTEITVNQAACEIFFIMTMSGQRRQRWGFASDSTILGTYCGDVMMPMLIDDTEGFMVEIIYADGSRTEALPLNLTLGRHGAGGDISVYAVPCDGSVVEKIVFHNRKIDTDLNLAALTVNNTHNRLYPEMLIPEKPEKIVRDIKNAAEMTLCGSRLSIFNGALSMELDISTGVQLISMANAFTPQMHISSGAVLRLRDENNALIDCFNLISANVTRTAAELKYRYGDLIMTVCISFRDSSDILWHMTAENTGKNTIKTGIIFPFIGGLQYADNSDSWYFFPKYQNIDSNETVFIYEESAPSFPMQFLDVYSPSQQGGLSLTTEERGLLTRKYALQKDDNGVEFYVEHPRMYTEIAPGGEFCASPALLSAHSGDWHNAFRLYKDWLGSWYEPYHCQDKKWYRECFWLLAEITDFFETNEFTHLPVWYDKEKNKFNFLDILEEQKGITGCYPDILHLWGWTNNGDSENFKMEYGNFGGSDYDQYGGAENFRNALHQVQDETGVHVSLYLHPTLLTAKYPQSEHFYRKHKVINDIGENIIFDEDSFRICHANDEWRKFAVDMYPRIYRELGIPLLYVDEFSLRMENKCYGEGHGHPIPSNLLQTDRALITELKESLPDDVVLYGEYAAVDVNARYIDCNISYYIIDSVVDMIETAWRGNDGDDRLGRVYMNLYRFAFPKIVQLVLPMAMRNLSWHPQKFLFFNGEAIYDSFWDCEESAGLDFTIHAYSLKKQYADCFSSDTPEPMVETLSPAICANCFPGNNRTLYTLYNRAYITYRGDVLRLRHTPGNRYYDAWNERPIDAVIKDGYAVIPYEIHAQQIGCIIVEKVTD